MKFWSQTGQKLTAHKIVVKIEVPEFIKKYGEENPYRSYKFYSSQDMEEFGRIRPELLNALPLTPTLSWFSPSVRHIAAQRKWMG